MSALSLRPITEKRYHWAAEVICPPAAWSDDGHLLGEPVSHRVCRITGQISPTYRGFCRFTVAGEIGHFETSEPATPEEWEEMDVLTLPILAGA